MAYSAMAVANAFVSRAKAGKLRNLSPMKLQKLLFFAQSWSMARTDEPLFDEFFSRWQYGPVLPSLYHEFKEYGANTISTYGGHLVEQDGDLVRVRPIVSESDTETWSLIDEIIQVYGAYSGSQLSAITHEPGSAWKETGDIGGEPITNTALAKYIRNSRHFQPEAAQLSNQEAEDNDQLTQEDCGGVPLTAPVSMPTDLTTSGNASSAVSGPKHPRKPRVSKIVCSPDSVMESSSTTAVSPSKEEIAEQVALPSNEDVPPPGSRKKSTVKEDLIFEEVYNQKANRALRGTYADKAYELASGCIQFWAVLISANAIIFALTGKLMVSDNALIAITTGVTVNVLAAFLGVIRGLFPSESTKMKKKKKIKKVKKS